MPQKFQPPPSPQELRERIIVNLNRVQGYIDVLLEEIEDPERQGPEFEREVWHQKATALQSNLLKLSTLIHSKTWE